MRAIRAGFRGVAATALLVLALSACAAAPVGTAGPAAPVVATTAAANAPHPLTTLPGVRTGVTPGRASASLSTLPVLPSARATGTVLPARPGPTPVPVTAVDGCNRAYGTADQCVPMRAPGGKPVTCAYLRSSGLFAAPLVVVSDPWGLLKKKHVVRSTTVDGRYTTIMGCTD